MARRRTHPAASKQHLAQEFLAGDVALHAQGKRHDVSRDLIRGWVEKYERGDFGGEHEAADVLERREARIAPLERLVVRLALENGMLKGASRLGRAPNASEPSVISGPADSASPKGAA